MGKEGFLGEVLRVEFDYSEAINTLQSIWLGAECLVTITGELTSVTSDKLFNRTLKDKRFKGLAG
jgi:hypothetical protein